MLVITLVGHNERKLWNFPCSQISIQTSLSFKAYYFLQGFWLLPTVEIDKWIVLYSVQLHNIIAHIVVSGDRISHRNNIGKVREIAIKAVADINTIRSAKWQTLLVTFPTQSSVCLAISFNFQLFCNGFS